MSASNLPELPRIASTENPWKVPLIDLRPITLGMQSVTSDPQVAATFGAMCGSDGLEFVDAAREIPRTHTTPVRFALDGPLGDGVLSAPTVMEDKWVVFLHQGMLLGVRSWHAQIGVVADVIFEDGALVARSYGGLLLTGATPEQGAQQLEFFVRTLVGRELLPVPLLSAQAPEGSDIGLVCMSEWGRWAQYATHVPMTYAPGGRALRCQTLLHRAAARGDLDAINTLVGEGAPLEARGFNGETPLLQAVASNQRKALESLVALGASVLATDDAGATPVSLAASAKRKAMAKWLIAHGATAHGPVESSAR